MKRNNEMKNLNETLKELFIGIFFYGIIIEITGLCLVRQKGYFSIGLWFGILLALAAAFHMWRSLDIGMDLGESAGKYVISRNLIRYGVIVIAFGALCITDLGNPLAAFAGIMGLKAGAYLQPFTHKIMTKLKRR